MHIPAPEPKIDLTTSNGITELETRVECLLDGNIRNFQVIVGDKGVTIRGQAHTYLAKQLAKDVVLEATELPILADEIEVWGPTYMVSQRELGS
jgi:hypothetical protein